MILFYLTSFYGKANILLWIPLKLVTVIATLAKLRNFGVRCLQGVYIRGGWSSFVCYNLVVCLKVRVEEFYCTAHTYILECTVFMLYIAKPLENSCCGYLSDRMESVLSLVYLPFSSISTLGPSSSTLYLCMQFQMVCYHFLQ